MAAVSRQMLEEILRERWEGFVNEIHEWPTWAGIEFDDLTNRLTSISLDLIDEFRLVPTKSEVVDSFSSNDTITAGVDIDNNTLTAHDVAVVNGLKNDLEADSAAELPVADTSSTIGCEGGPDSTPS